MLQWRWTGRAPYGRTRSVARVRDITGIVCILLAILLLLFCAPGWLVALILSGLLFMLGAWILFGCGTRGPFR